MDTIEEPVLFGAPAGGVSGVSLQITNYGEGAWGVILHVHQTNRSQLLTLKAVAYREQSLPDLLGRLMPLILRTDHLGVTLARRTLWAMHNRLGEAGYEVELRNCGADPRK